MKRLSERVDMRLGYRCNARCGFCYYQDSLKSQDGEPKTAQVKERIKTMRQEGAREIEFTGGEPTIRKDVVELVAFAKAMGYVNISFITNGLKLADSTFSRRLIAAGANDFLFSIHGHTSDLHDRQTGVKGSYCKIITAVHNVREMGARCRGTTTVNGQNYRYISAILDRHIELNMKCIHIAVFSPVAQANMAIKDFFVTYTDATDYIKSAIDRHKGYLPPLSVKYVPFCFMTGYEKHVMNLYQQSFDPDDWNYYLSQKARRADKWLFRKTVSLVALTGGAFLKNHSFPLKYGLEGLKIFGATRLVEILRKKRLKVCRACRYDIVCDHVWREYLAKFGETEFLPVPGFKIVDPAWCYEFAGYRLTGIPVAAPIA